MHLKRLAPILLIALAGCGGDAAPVSPEVRAAGLRFATGVRNSDREWILAAIEQARPEARALVDDVDGMVVVSTFSDRRAREVGLTTRTAPGSYDVSFNLAILNADRKIDRPTTVLHEFGHVVDDA